MRLLVVSYDPDQQQWFHDMVEAPTADEAEGYICALRDYVIADDALPVETVRQWTKPGEPDYSTDDTLAQCQDCQAIHPTSELKTIEDYFQRVEPGEPAPSGECPECGALCQPLEKPV